MATRWEYCILTRLSAGLDTKWHLNRIFQHTDGPELPEEVTAKAFRQYNDKFDALHAQRIYPILPAILNLLGADGWELIDDMNTGLAGGEGLVFKRPTEAPARKAAAKPKKKASARRR
jgi:hypothetical protein